MNCSEKKDPVVNISKMGEATAVKFHRDHFVVDAHFDLPIAVREYRKRGETNVVERRYLEGFRKAGLDLVVASLFIADVHVPERALSEALAQIADLDRDLSEGAGDVVLCRDMNDVEAVRASGGIALLLCFEGAEPLGSEPVLLRAFRKLGVSGLGLAWNRRNALCDGTGVCPADSESGLTRVGRDMVEQAVALGMFLDVSHLAPRGFWDLMEMAPPAVIASHCDSRSLVDHPRNLDDAQVRALAKVNGVIGVNACCKFVGIDFGERRLGAVDLADHVDRLVELAGIDHVGVGLDLCDHLYEFTSLSDGTDPAYDVISGHGEYPLLTLALMERGYRDGDLVKILGGNFRRVLSRVL